MRGSTRRSRSTSAPAAPAAASPVPAPARSTERYLADGGRTRQRNARTSSSVPVAGGTCIGIPVDAAAAPASTTAAASPSTRSTSGTSPINTTVTRRVTLTIDAGYRAVDRVRLRAQRAVRLRLRHLRNRRRLHRSRHLHDQPRRYTPRHPVRRAARRPCSNVPSSAARASPITVAVSGTGVSTAAATPSSIDFGNVPINTTVTQPVTITVDAGYRDEIASGSGINAPFGFGFNTCGTGGGFTGPGTCTINQTLHADGDRHVQRDDERVRVPRRRRLVPPRSPTRSPEAASATQRKPVERRLRRRADQHDGHAGVTITVDAGYRTKIASGSGINAPFGFGFGTCGAGGGFTGPGTCTIKQKLTPTATGSSSGTTNVFECPVAGGTCVAFRTPPRARATASAPRRPARAVDRLRRRADQHDSDPG